MQKIIILAFILFLQINYSDAAMLKFETHSTKLTLIDNQILDVSADFYRPKNKVKAILYLSPTIDGISFLEKELANYFSHHDFLVIIPHPYKTAIDDVHPTIIALNQDNQKPILVANYFIQLAFDDLEIGQLPVFALGASQGGIRTISIAANIPSVKAAWFHVAGGNFPYIYAYSEVDAIKKFRARFMADLSLSSFVDFEQYLKQNLIGDPIDICSKINAPIVQVMALKDTKVPTKTQLELNESCPEHRLIKVNAGHVFTATSMIYFQGKIRKFFESNI